MYKNVYYDRTTNVIHLWDDQRGYLKFQHNPYCFIESSEPTKYKTIFGDYVKRYNDNPTLLSPHINVYESDVYTEIQFLKDKYYKVSEPPKNVRVMAFDIEVARSKKYGYSEPKDAWNEVLSVFCRDNLGNKVALLLDKYGRYRNVNNYEYVQTYSSEIHLLKAFLNYIDQYPVDIWTGWYSMSYDIPYLYNRIKRVFGRMGLENNLSPIGKCFYKEQRNIVDIGGISHLDYMELYKNYTFKKLPSYSLEYVSQYELDEGKVEYEGDLQTLYENDIDEFMRYNIQDVDLIFKLDDKLGFIDQNITIAVTSHVPFEYALHSTLYQEGRFLTETKKRNLVVPNRPKVDKDIPLIGAYVKESKAGLFDWVYDQDLASLYPFIIVTLNLSPETKAGKIRNYIRVWKEKNKPVEFKINYPVFDPSQKRPDADKEINIVVDMKDGRSIRLKRMGDLYEFMEKENLTLSGNGIFFSKDKMGIIPEIMLNTYKERSEFKKLRNKYLKAGDKDKADYYDLKQMAWKILLNSFYGVMGNRKFRFFDPDLAQSITLTGRFVTQSGMDEVKRLHKKMYDDLSDELKSKMDEQMRELFKDPHLTGDTDSVILTAMPILYAKFGDDWKTMDEDELVDFVSRASHKISKIINKRMNVFSDSWLNADKNYLRFKEEWVARRGFYLGVKKRYANWIIWQEGVTIPEEDRKPEVKGLDIVRSDFPKHLQDFMRNILEELLQKGLGVKDEIMEYIVDFKDNLRDDASDDIETIAVKSSANNMEKYTDPKNSRRAIKGAPFHVVGAINYNAYLEIKGYSKEYQKITEGDRIGVVYLRSNRLGFGHVSFPIDYRVPEEFEQFLDEYCNRRLTIKKLLDNKLQKYYDALGWEKPNEKFKSIESFFA